MDEGQFNQAPRTYVEVANWCCAALGLSVECRPRSNYGVKCGFVPAPFSTGVKRFFRNVAGTFFAKIEGTRTYSNPEACMAPLDAPAGEVECTTSFTASCETPEGSQLFSYDVDMDELASPFEDHASETGASEVGAGAGVCIYFSELFTRTDKPGRGAIGVPGFAFFATGFDAGGPDSIQSEADGIVTWKIGEPGLPWARHETGEAGTYPCDFVYDETVQIEALLTVTEEFTTDQLKEQVTGGELAVGEYGEECCAESTLDEDEAGYEYTELDVRLSYTPPCVGTVRVYIEITETLPGEEPTTEVMSMDDPGDGSVSQITPPIFGTRCVSAAWAEIV